VVQNQYKADGTLDEEATKAKTTTLEEDTYQQGKNFGDKTMQAVDIAVAVGAVVAAVVLMIIPGTQALAGFCIAAAAAMYAVARNGISTHDLGMFGENHDRAEGKHNAMVFCSSVVTVAVAGAAAWMSAPSRWQQAPRLGREVPFHYGEHRGASAAGNTVRLWGGSAFWYRAQRS
jgi:hypothetical protein